MKSQKLSIPGEKNMKNKDDDVEMKTNLNCKYLYEERFLFPFFNFSFFSFYFLVFFGTYARFFLCAVSQCVTVSVNSLQCLSVQESINPISNLYSDFDAICLFVYFSAAISSPSALSPEHWTVAKTSVERSFERCQSVCWSFLCEVSLPGACGTLWSSFRCPPPSLRPCFPILATPPAAKSIERWCHGFLYEAGTVAASGRWKCSLVFHSGAKQDCLHALWQTSWQKKKKKEKKTFLCYCFSFCVCVVASRNHSSA